MQNQHTNVPIRVDLAGQTAADSTGVIHHPLGESFTQVQNSFGAEGENYSYLNLKCFLQADVLKIKLSKIWIACTKKGDVRILLRSWNRTEGKARVLKYTKLKTKRVTCDVQLLMKLFDLCVTEQEELMMLFCSGIKFSFVPLYEFSFPCSGMLTFCHNSLCNVPRANCLGVGRCNMINVIII